MYMKDWVVKLDDILRISERDILTHAGKIAHDDSIKHANTQFDQFQHEKSLVEQHFEESLKQLDRLEEKFKNSHFKEKP